MDRRSSEFWYLLSSKSAITSWTHSRSRPRISASVNKPQRVLLTWDWIHTLIMCAKYFPSTWLSVLMKISLRMDSPIGLYLELNLSKRWNVLRS